MRSSDDVCSVNLPSGEWKYHERIAARTPLCSLILRVGGILCPLIPKIVDALILQGLLKREECADFFFTMIDIHHYFPSYHMIGKYVHITKGSKTDTHSKIIFQKYVY